MYEIDYLNIGESLKRYRKLNHYSLENVGNKICKTKATVSKYEKGEIIPDLLTILELCNVFNIDISSLLRKASNNASLLPKLSNDKLYLYYLTDKKVITSIINIIITPDGEYKAILYNGVKKNTQNYAYYYEGDIEYSEYSTYINLKNLNSNKFSLERVHIIISLPLSNTINCCNCFISGMTPNFLPIIKRGLVSSTPLNIDKKYIDKLKISKQEISQIINDNAWILNTKLYDEFFYDFN